MKRKFFLPLLIVMLVLATVSSAQAGLALPVQKMAVPTYFYPGTYWAQLQSGAPIVGLAIINPASGPGRKIDQNYVSTVKSAQASGLIVLGYVYSSYGKRSAATVKAEINKYFTWYGVNGIFIDEASNNCKKKTYYLNLYKYVKSKSKSNKVVINPGTNTQECYMATADIILNFENIYSEYVNWSLSGWETNYPADRFWHLVYGASAVEMTNAIALSKGRNAGWIYVTDDLLPNPWDTLPADPYWTDELTLINQ